MLLPQVALVTIGLLLAAWTLAAGVVVLLSRARLARAEAGRRTMQRFARLVEESPAIPLLVRADGRIEGPQRLAAWFGFDQLPQYLSELEAPESQSAERRGAHGLAADELAKLTAAVRRAQKSAAPFQQIVTPVGSSRRLALRGHLADAQISPGGAALVWVFDVTDAGAPPVEPRREAERARDDFPALVSLIEAAPQPMWLRRPDGGLRLANAAYAAAVGAAEPAEAVARQLELVESADGHAPRDLALQAVDDMKPAERRVMATVAGQRRALRVTDLPLGDLGIAGYAIDIEELEELGRTFRAYRDAQRSVIDSLSAGVAQFDVRRQLVHANKPFQRIFALDRGVMASGPTLERVLDAAWHAGRLPEMRDYADWRRERVGWFAASEPQQEDWTLPSGEHVRIVAQPQPDGDLLVVAEDRTEQLRLSALRDTMLRTRNATLDSLFESVAVFASDGRLQLWNRRFASDWSLEGDYLDTHPHVDLLLAKIAPQLQQPADAAGVGEAVRAATVERRESGGRVQLAEGRTMAFNGVPLPDGSGLLVALDVGDQERAEEVLRERNAAPQDAGAVRERIALQPFAEHLVAERQVQLRAAGLTLDLQCDENAGEVAGEGAMLTHAIGHLLDNAIATTPAGGRILFDLSRQSSAEGGDHARIVVSDNGPGLDAAKLRQALVEGSTLGDAQRHIKAEGGRLELLSELGQGTAAIVELP